MASFLKKLFSPKMEKPPKIEELIEELNTHDDVEQEAVLARLLPSDDQQLVERLIEALSHPSPWVRKGAAKALGHLREPRAVAPLLQNLPRRNNDIEVYTGEVVEALGDIGDTAAVGPLARLLSDKMPSALYFTLPIALAKLGERQSIPWLIGQATASKFVTEARLTAVNCLEKIADNRDRASLERAIGELKSEIDFDKVDHRDTSGTERLLAVMERLLSRIPEDSPTDSSKDSPKAAAAANTTPSQPDDKLAKQDPAKVKALRSAASNGDVKAVRALLDEGVDPNAVDPTTEGMTPLLSAARWGHTEVIKALLEKGANVNTVETGEGNTALTYAAENNHLEVLQLLLERGADMNIQTKYLKQTALMCAARRGRFAIAKALLDKGASLDEVSTYDDSTALTWAADNKYADIVGILLEKGADVNKKAALCNGVLSENVEIVQAMLNKRADVNAVKQKTGWTPLMYAASTGRSEIAQLLLQKGAQVNARTKDDWTALKIAHRFNHDGVVRLLKGAGGEE